MTQAERQRVYRERIQDGRVVVQLELSQDIIDRLVAIDRRLSWLDADHPEYRDILGAAVRHVLRVKSV